MNDEALKTLKELLQQYGGELCRNRQKLEGLLKDYCNQHRREINVLTAAAKEGIAEELRQLSKTEVDEFAYQRLVKRLHEEGGIDRQCAEWSVSGWALALGKKLPKVSGGSSSSSKSAHPSGAGQPHIPEGFVYVEGGIFMMGSPEHESGRYENETLHMVTLSSFCMGKYPVTQKEWQKVMGTNSSKYKGDNRPVENVNWYDVVRYCIRRSHQEGLNPAYQIEGKDDVKWDRDANGYRLPTEAEWEYAARGGSSSRGYKYAGGGSVDDVGWYWKNSGDKRLDGDWDIDKIIANNGRTQPVGGKTPNELGLYDMSGNVWEWCWDWYGSYSSGSQTNPKGPGSGRFRMIRGGSWDDDAGDLRSAGRASDSPGGRGSFLGFRLVRQP